MVNLPGENKQTLASLGRQAAAVAAIITAITGVLPPKLQIWGFLSGAALLGIEHYVGDPSTGSTPPTSGTGLT